MVDITPEVITAFRTAYPAYSSTTDYPDAVVTQSLCEGDAETGGAGWGAYEGVCHNFKQRGMFLYAAHWLATTYPNGAASGNMNGATNQLVQSKSVGDESVTFASTGGGQMSAGDTWLASTSFGQQWLRLRRRAGMGARAV